MLRKTELNHIQLCSRGLSSNLIKNSYKYRYSSKYSDIVPIGYKSHKVLDNIFFDARMIHVHKDSQNASVRRHGLDMVANVSKFIREKRSTATNRNDTLHVSVSTEKDMTQIQSGAKCRGGKRSQFTCPM